MNVPRPRSVLVLGALLLAGCGGPPAGGDPGGRRLKELAGDQVFSALPAGATLVGRTQKKAWYQKPGFTGGGWNGPTVAVNFTSPEAPADVYRFFGERAAAAGWQPTAVGSFGVTDSWAKTYPGGASATFSIARLGVPPPGGAGTYVLDGGVAPVLN
jgi:hypothetical protein